MAIVSWSKLQSQNRSQVFYEAVEVLQLWGRKTLGANWPATGRFMSAQAPAKVSICLPVVHPTPDTRPFPSDSGMGSGAPQRVLEATVSLHAYHLILQKSESQRRTQERVLNSLLRLELDG